ncbi:hypothetical protein KKG29_04390, partial [Patescibacteria group bacterium]|nr:hypothetical protein [Patescibacteria group bacterium]
MGKITYNKQKEIIKADSEIFSRIGFEKNYFFISKDKSKVTYSALGKTYNFRDPEEKVRIEYYFDLLEKYNYPIMRIELEVEMPSRTP